MNKVKNILLAVYVLFLAFAGAVYVAGEFLEMDLAWLSGTSATRNYVIQMVMILLTLGQIPLALRLFRFTNIHRELISYPEQAMLKWGIIRILLLGVLLVANILLYYFYAFEPAYGYLAIIVLLSMPFILPTLSRCEAETTEDEVAEQSADENKEEVEA